mgnify:CR=1 FL=1
MGALKIDCFCSETQMCEIIRTITNYLNTLDRDELCDIDEEIAGVRVCIDLEVFMDVIKLKAAEVLDDDWEPLFEDSAVLTSRLRPMIEAYNQNYTQARRQAQGIRKDQLSELGINITI